jgi:hypothetical protein
MDGLLQQPEPTHIPGRLLGWIICRGPLAALQRSRGVYRMRHEVTETDTGAALGSGDVPVLATPRLIAWMEAATVRAATAFLGTGQTTVATAIRMRVACTVVVATPARQHRSGKRGCRC